MQASPRLRSEIGSSASAIAEIVAVSCGMYDVQLCTLMEGGKKGWAGIVLGSSACEILPGLCISSEFVSSGHVTGLIHFEMLVLHASSVSISHTANVRRKSQLLLHVSTPYLWWRRQALSGFAFYGICAISAWSGTATFLWRWNFNIDVDGHFRGDPLSTPILIYIGPVCLIADRL